MQFRKALPGAGEGLVHAIEPVVRTLQRPVTRSLPQKAYGFLVPVKTRVCLAFG